MLSKPLSNKQIEAAFNKFIADPSAGIPSDSGFDSKTESALYQVMMDPSPISIALARKELALQLNGTHAKENAAKIEAMLQQSSRKKRS